MQANPNKTNKKSLKFPHAQLVTQNDLGFQRNIFRFSFIMFIIGFSIGYIMERNNRMFR